MHDAASARRLRDDEQPIAEEPRLRLIEPEDGPLAQAERRTITITGHPTPERRRRPSPTQAHIAARPDRVALWAVVLGMFLVAVAAGTAHAAPL